MTERVRTAERKFPVCDVTDKNFATVFPEFCDVVDDADFIAIDLEFTGTIRRPCVRHCLDTPEMRYHKAREGGVDHGVIQFGVSAFSWQPSTKRHTVASFNFWIFPSSGDERRSRYFMCDSSSLSFLVRNGCDFNKLFREGIPYLTRVERDEWCEKIRQQYAHKFAALAAADSAQQQQAAATTNKSSKTLQQSDKNGGAATTISNENGLVNGDAEELPDFLKKAVTQIDGFLAADAPTLPDDTKASLELDLDTGFKRKQFYDLVLPRYKDVVVARTQQVQYNNSGAAGAVDTTADPVSNQQQQPSQSATRPCIKIEKCSAADRRKWLEQRQAEELAKVDKHYAFTAVVDKIRDAGRPVVVHNGFLDLCLTFHHFITPLPESYDDFLLLYQRVWPTLFDTRLIADTAPLRDELSSVSSLGLERIYEMLGGRNICKNQLAPRKLSIAAATAVAPATPNAKQNDGTASPPSSVAPAKISALAKPDFAEDSEVHAHMAGYDAFMTGACFVSMLRRICSLSQASPRDRAHMFPVNQWCFAAGSPAYAAHRHPVGDVLFRLQNKLFLSRPHDYPCIDFSLPLTPSTPNSLTSTSSTFLKVPTRKNVFYITFPAEWGLNDIQDRFKQYGRIRVEFIDSVSAALILQDAMPPTNGGPNEMTPPNSSGNGQKSVSGKLHGEDLLRVFLQERVNSSADKQCIVMRYHRLMRELVKATLPATTSRLQQKGKFEEFITRQISGATTSPSPVTSKAVQSAYNSLLTSSANNGSSNNLPTSINRGSPAKQLLLNPPARPGANKVYPSISVPLQSGGATQIFGKDFDEPRLGLHPAQRIHRASSMPRPESADKTKTAAAFPVLSSESSADSMTDVSMTSSSISSALGGLLPPQSVTEPVSRRSGESITTTEQQTLSSSTDADSNARNLLVATGSHNHQQLQQRAAKRPRLSASKFGKNSAAGAPAAAAAAASTAVNQGNFAGAPLGAPSSGGANSYVSRYKLVRPTGSAGPAGADNNQEETSASSVNNESKTATSSTSTVAGTASTPLQRSARGSDTDLTRSVTTKRASRSAALEPATFDAVQTKTPPNEMKSNKSGAASVGEHVLNGKAEDITDGASSDPASPKVGAQKIMAVGKSLRRKNSVSQRVSKRKKSTSS